MRKEHWLNLVGVIVGFASFILEWLTPFWGLVFLYWVAGGIKSHEIVLFQKVKQEESPILYWSIVLLWVMFGLYLLLYPLL